MYLIFKQWETVELIKSVGCLNVNSESFSGKTAYLVNFMDGRYYSTPRKTKIRCRKKFHFEMKITESILTFCSYHEQPLNFVEQSEIAEGRKFMIIICTFAVVLSLICELLLGLLITAYYLKNI